MKRSISFAFAALILLSAASAPGASAQWFGGPPEQQKKKRPPPPPMPANSFYTTSLTQAPALAYFPTWTGQKPLFLDGHSYPNLQPIESYTVAWAFKEPAGTVIGWYGDALQGQGWVINRTISRENMIVARHGKEPLEIQFQVSPSAKPGYRCTAEVRWTKNPKFGRRPG